MKFEWNERDEGKYLTKDIFIGIKTFILLFCLNEKYKICKITYQL